VVDCMPLSFLNTDRYINLFIITWHTALLDVVRFQPCMGKLSTRKVTIKEFYCLRGTSNLKKKKKKTRTQRELDVDGK